MFKFELAKFVQMFSTFECTLQMTTVRVYFFPNLNHAGFLLLLATFFVLGAGAPSRSRGQQKQKVKKTIDASPQVSNGKNKK